MKSKIVVWGLGRIYRKYANLLKYFEYTGQIEVVGVTSQENCYKEVDGYSWFITDEIINMKFDYLFIAAEGHEYEEIRKKAINLRVNELVIFKISILNIPGIDIRNYAELYASNISVIAINCWGGLILHSLGMKFNSPFVNMFVLRRDYLKMLTDLEYYMMSPLEFVKWHYDCNTKRRYPIMKIGDVELHFNHNEKIEDAIEVWNRRKKRINYNNLFVMFYTESVQEAELFEKLPFDKKICFTSFECNLKSAYYLEIRKNLQDVPFYEIVNGCVNGRYQVFNEIDILSGNMEGRCVI